MTVPMTANPRRTVISELTGILSPPATEDEDEIITTYAIFNNPDTVDRLVSDGKIHPIIADKLKEPLWSAETDGPAVRFLKWTNRNRSEGSDRDGLLGPAILRVQTLVKKPWRTMSDEEVEAVDDGTRANG